MEKFNMTIDEHNNTILIGFDDSVDVNFVCWTKFEKWLQDEGYYERIIQFFPINKFIAIGCDMGEHFDSFVTDLNTFFHYHSDDKPEVEEKKPTVEELLKEVIELKHRIHQLESKS